MDALYCHSTNDEAYVNNLSWIGHFRMPYFRMCGVKMCLRWASDFSPSQRSLLLFDFASAIESFALPGIRFCLTNSPLHLVENLYFSISSALFFLLSSHSRSHSHFSYSIWKECIAMFAHIRFTVYIVAHKMKYLDDIFAVICHKVQYINMNEFDSGRLRRHKEQKPNSQIPNKNEMKRKLWNRVKKPLAQQWINIELASQRPTSNERRIESGDTRRPNSTNIYFLVEIGVISFYELSHSIRLGARDISSAEIHNINNYVPAMERHFCAVQSRASGCQPRKKAANEQTRWRTVQWLAQKKQSIFCLTIIHVFLRISSFLLIGYR